MIFLISGKSERQVIMAKGDIKLSRKYGLNPTIPVCFWCGEERNEVAVLGEVKDRNGREVEMPMHACIDYIPCEECQKKMSLGFTLIEATSEPNSTTSREIQSGVYPTGRWIVIKPEAARQVFNNLPEEMDKAFIDPEVWEMIMRQ